MRVFLCCFVLMVQPSVGFAADHAKTSAEVDLATAQGCWKIASKIVWFPNGDPPPIMKLLAADNATLSIVGNQLTVGDLAPVSIANDVHLPRQQKQIEQSVRGQKLLRITLPEGKAIMASYSVTSDSLNIRYPAGCCSRSGTVLFFSRVKP